jgi:hypothetical protein
MQNHTELLPTKPPSKDLRMIEKTKQNFEKLLQTIENYRRTKEQNKQDEAAGGFSENDQSDPEDHDDVEEEEKEIKTGTIKKKPFRLPPPPPIQVHEVEDQPIRKPLTKTQQQSNSLVQSIISTLNKRKSKDATSIDERDQFLIPMSSPREQTSANQNMSVRNNNQQQTFQVYSFQSNGQGNAPQNTNWVQSNTPLGSVQQGWEQNHVSQKTNNSFWGQNNAPRNANTSSWGQNNASQMANNSSWEQNNAPQIANNSS